MSATPASCGSAVKRHLGAGLRAAAVALLIAQAVPAAQAETPGPTAGTVYLDCLLGEMTAVDAKGALCGFALWGFVTGYVEGASRGTSSALIYDPEASSTVKGIADLRRRVAALRTRARCVPPNPEMRELIASFTKYMGQHLERGNEPLGPVLHDVVRETYRCDR